MQPRVILALGAVAHRAVLMALRLRRASIRFGIMPHTTCLPGAGASKGARLFDSYHCSRYNTQTKRLTAAMFEAVFRDIQAFLLRSR